MLFWLGSVEFETPSGRFILTGALEVYGLRRRRATKEESAQVWSFVETQLQYASPHELRPLYELYQELTSNPFNGLHGEPHPSLVLNAVRHALWANQVHFEFEEPFGPLLEPELEPIPFQDLVKRVQSASPSELWGRRDSAPEADVHFKVRLVDETEQAVPDIYVSFTHAGSTETEKTDGLGTAEYASTGAPSASVIIESLDELEEVLIERWQTFRTPTLLEGAEASRLALHEIEQTTALTHAKPHTIQIVPELGCIYLELVDKSGRVRHVNCPYQIAGPQAFAGITDENALLKHDDVFPGKYLLTLELDAKVYKTPVEVLRAGTGEPQVRKLGVVPRSVMASVRGFVFEKNKAFVMPAAIESMQEVRQLFLSTVPNDILIVGHTDTTADAKTNDPLSLSRADGAKAMLLGDIDAWLTMYGTSMPEKHRWGSREDNLMIAAMPDYAAKPKSEGPVWWYQRTRGLKQDGECGKSTRAKLIEEYMGLVGEPLSKDPEFTSPLTTHGCGENFPLDDTGAALVAKPEDGKEDAIDRRVEFFFFDAEYGIVPAVPGKNSKAGSAEYTEWRRRAVQLMLFGLPGRVTLRMFLYDREAKLSRNAPYRLEVAGEIREGFTSADGCLYEEGLMDGQVAQIEWTPSQIASGIHPRYHTEFAEVHLNCTDSDTDAQRVDRELRNLGYLNSDREANRNHFSKEFGPATPSSDEGIHDAHCSGTPKACRVPIHH